MNNQTTLLVCAIITGILLAKLDDRYGYGAGVKLGSAVREAVIEEPIVEPQDDLYFADECIGYYMQIDLPFEADDELLWIERLKGVVLSQIRMAEVITNGYSKLNLEDFAATNCKLFEANKIEINFVGMEQ